MTEREAIANIEYARSWLGSESDFSDEALDMAISALEKQEKKPAKAKFNKRYNRFVYFCPVCGEVTGHYDYCSDCGQAIDYDNPEPYKEEEEL